MSGARLETMGQVRNVFPYVVYKSFVTQITVINGVSAVVPYGRALIQTQDDLPFDKGPDKSGRLFVVINGADTVTIAGVPGAGAQVIGEIFFSDTFGYETHLSTILTGTITVNPVLSSTPRILVPYNPLFGPQLDSIGTIVWRDFGSVGGSAQNVVVRTRINIGFYGDYAEYDFSKLEKYQPEPLVEMHSL